jgi:hypothetical protein
MMRPCLAALILLATCPPVHGQDGPCQDLQVQTNMMMQARDGIWLAADIYRPAASEPPAPERLPVLLHRTPYDKGAAPTVAIARSLACHGYVVVIQDTRGRHHSEGLFSKYAASEAADGYDAVEWAAALPYANGRVGMYGTSYAAHTQADAAKLNPPHLAALVLNMGGMADAWDHSVRNDGAFELGRQLSWAWRQILADTPDPVLRAALSGQRLEDWYDVLPLRKGASPLAAAPNYEAYFLEEMTNADDGPYWHGMAMTWREHYRQTADVPMRQIGGWYDIYLRGTIANWRELSRLKSAPQRLVIGPWTHHGNARTYAGEVDFGASAAIADFDVGYHLAWFDHWLKNGPAPDGDAPVRYFLMGGGDGGKDAAGRLRHGGGWRQTTTWPPAEARPLTLYLHAEGGLAGTPPTGGEPTVTRYSFDPRHPVPTIGGGVSARLDDGAFDQRERPDMPGSTPPYRPLAARPDVLVFETEPLAEDLVVAGPVTVRLFAATTGRDTDLTAKLIDVYPPSADFPEGFAMNLTDGIRRARYRGGRRVGSLLTPGRIYAIDIAPYDTANLFRKGHRLRLDISSSNFPRFDVNPNTGEPLGRNRRMMAVDNSIYHSPRFPSRLLLWTLPSP